MTIDARARGPVALDFERKPFYSSVEVAAILGISDETVRNWIHAGDLFAVHVGPRLIRIPLGALLMFLGQPADISRSRNPAATVDARTDDPQDAAEHKESR